MLLGVEMVVLAMVKHYNHLGWTVNFPVGVYWLVGGLAQLHFVELEWVVMLVMIGNCHHLV